MTAYAQKRRLQQLEHNELAARLEEESEDNLVTIIPLGAGQEVGRSCIILKYQGKSIMLDCGIHPGLSGADALPFMDGVGDTDISKVDVALITHFHLDHCAVVPHLINGTRFKGRVFMTHPTKAIYHSLIKDFARGMKGAEQPLYTEEDVDKSMERIQVVDFMQTIEVAGIQITPLRAGHVLGAAMFLVEVAGCRVLYTGDYSRVPDRHLPAADIPPVQPHVVIVESTYGVSRHLPREQREALFLQRVTDTLRAGGRVLLPVVALGRAQELLLLLDEYWEQHPELQGVPIYQASGQMRKSMRVYETYVEMMNEDVRAVFQHHNPFAFRHVTHLKSTAHFDDMGPCVMMATPSGLQSGTSREVFETWCDDRRNTVIICDFAVQGTLAREILGGPRDILTKTGVKKPLRCGVAHISFSAHADYEQTSGFLDTVQPPHVVLVHGEKTEMMRLKSALEKGAEVIGCTRFVYTPGNMQPIKIQHQPLRVARTAGRLSARPPRPGQVISGVLVAPAGGGGTAAQPLLLHPDDLPQYTKLHRGRITQRQAIATTLPWSEIRLSLEIMFEGVEGAGTWSVASIEPHTLPHTLPHTQTADNTGAGPSAVAGPSGGEGDKETEGKDVEQPPVKKEKLEGPTGADASASKEQEQASGQQEASADASTSQQGDQQPEQPADQQASQALVQSAAAAAQSTEPEVPPDQAVCVGQMVTVTHKPANPRAGYGSHVMVEWEGGKVSDMVADAVIAVLLHAIAERSHTHTSGGAQSEGSQGAMVVCPLGNAEKALAEARATQDEDKIAAAECDAVAALMATQFGPTHVDRASGTVHVQAGGTAGVPGSGIPLLVSPASGLIQCQDAALRGRVEKAVQRLLAAMRPIHVTPS